MTTPWKKSLTSCNNQKSESETFPLLQLEPSLHAVRFASLSGTTQGLQAWDGLPGGDLWPSSLASNIFSVPQLQCHPGTARQSEACSWCIAGASTSAEAYKKTSTCCMLEVPPVWLWNHALTSPHASNLQRSQLNQFANPTHMPEPKHNEISSNVHECNLQSALLDCSSESRAQNHIDQKMPCLMPDRTCDAGCDVPWTDDESETELL